MSGMFGGGTVNPYDDIVAKTTDENLTTENWELILNLCDKVNDEGQDGARNLLAALLKRLAHRNPNVQLYTLTLAEALSKNCGIEVHRELASKAWTGGLERIVVDRNTHDKVRKRILSLIAMWTVEFESDETLGIMEDCYKSLSAKGYKFETPSEPPPPTVDDEIRRKEEEELQRVLEMSIQDKGGRGAWAEYTSYGSSYADTAGASGSGSGSGSGSASRTNGYTPTTGTGSYVAPSGSGSGSASNAPSRSQTVSAVGPGSSPTPGPQHQQPQPQHQPSYSTSISNTSTTSLSSPTAGSNTPIVTRVKALHTFTPTEPGELAFDKGDIIKVVDRGYRDWWRGQLRGRTGIFPVNYVEPLPEPTSAELAREAEAEAAVFAQAINVEKLLTLLRSFDPTKSNLADDEEIQELYRSSMALRPKIVKLIDKYSQKRADLVSMNETFLRARNIFDRMMEDSLARHTNIYSEQPYAQSRMSTYNALPSQRPDSRVAYGQSPGPGGPGWGPGQTQLPGYDAAGAGPGYAGAPHFPQPAYPQQQQQPPAAYGGYGPQQQQPQPQPQGQGQPQTQSQPYGQSPYPSQQHQHVPQQQPQPQPEQQPQYQAQPQQQQQQAQTQTQPQTQAQPQTQQPTTHTQPQGNPAGPPYVYDPKTTYPDPNVQAWAQYYAQGGTDPTGSVYFISVPGVKEAAPGAPPTASTGNEVQQQQQPQRQYQPQGQGQMQGQAQVQGGQQPQQQPQHQVYQQTSPAGSVHSVHSAHSLHAGIIPGGPGGSSGSVDNLPNPYSGTGDAAPAGGNPGASGPGTVQRESSLPDPYANATAPAPASSIVGGGPGSASPTSPAYTSTATGPVVIAPGPGSPTGLSPHTPTTPAYPQNNALGAPSSPYNHPNTSQPSWLLPKMGSPPKSFYGAGEGDVRTSSPQSVASGHVGGGYGQSSLFHGIQGQMGGLSLNDGPPAGQGQPPQQGGYQGVGATA